MQPFSPPVQPSPPESLPRLLREWGLAPASSAAPVAARLGAWLGWADAITISQVLSTPPGRAASSAARAEVLRWAGTALEQVRAELAAGFDAAALAATPEAGEAALADALAPSLQQFAQQQRAIATRVTTLRAQLRAGLAKASDELARLALFDEYIERALATPERRAMTGLAALLETRARRHHAADPRRWHLRLRSDLQRMLRAELDQRLQPVLGLIEALSTSSPR